MYSGIAGSIGPWLAQPQTYAHAHAQSDAYLQQNMMSEQSLCNQLQLQRSRSWASQLGMSSSGCAPSGISGRLYKKDELPQEDRSHCLDALRYQMKMGPIEKQKESKKMGSGYIREYFIKHRDLLMGLTVVLLLDHFIFEGAFREKIKRIVHSFLDKAENKIHEIEVVKA